MQQRFSIFIIIFLRDEFERWMDGEVPFTTEPQLEVEDAGAAAAPLQPPPRPTTPPPTRYCCLLSKLKKLLHFFDCKRK